MSDSLERLAASFAERTRAYELLLEAMVEARSCKRDKAMVGTIIETMQWANRQIADEIDGVVYEDAPPLNLGDGSRGDAGGA